MGRSNCDSHARHLARRRFWPTIVALLAVSILTVCGALAQSTPWFRASGCHDPLFHPVQRREGALAGSHAEVTLVGRDGGSGSLTGAMGNRKGFDLLPHFLTPLTAINCT